jgi:hypothetical protein
MTRHPGSLVRLQEISNKSFGLWIGLHMVALLNLRSRQAVRL